jgi:hypothetical protein
MIMDHINHVNLTPADMARPFNTYKKIVFRSKKPSPSAGTTPTLNLPFFTREIVLF